MNFGSLESILVVYQNPQPGRKDAYDEWYTNVHLRDAMRLDGALATQRFEVCEDQPNLNGQDQRPAHWAHTIYEWESAAKSVTGHAECAGTPLMQVTKDGQFEGLRDYYYKPLYLSHGWTPEQGFRRGPDVLTAAIAAPKGGDAEFRKWFLERHAPDTLALPGVATAGLFALHEEQSLPIPCKFPYVAIYSLSDRAAALKAWSERHAGKSDADLSAAVKDYELGCWKPRIERLLAADVIAASPEAQAKEHAIRVKHADRYFTQEELWRVLEGV